MASTVSKDPSYIVPLLLPDPTNTSVHEAFQVFSPADPNGPIWKAASASQEQVDLAVEEASKALQSWGETPVTVRRDALLKVASLLENYRDELGDIMSFETGAPESWTKGFNVHAGTEFAKEIAGRISSECTNGQWNSSSIGKGSIVWTEPIGVVLAVAPWNAPLLLGLRSVLYPIAAGCTVVFKGSERCPRSHYLMCSILQQAFPRGVITMVLAPAGDPNSITKRMIHHPAIRKINFTGSTMVGRIIAREAGEALKPVLLELGGKAPAVILEDADLEKAAMLVLEGSFMNAGQICMSTERVIVVKSIYDSFVQQLQKAAPHISLPGPLISASAEKNYDSLYFKALAEGAQPLSMPFPDFASPSLKPRVLTNVHPSDSVFTTESFAPLLVITAADSDSHAIELANATPYGLSASIFSRNLFKALKLARRLQSGAVHINGMTVHDEPTLPHGGVKASGTGRFGAGAGVREFLTTKVVTFEE